MKEVGEIWVLGIISNGTGILYGPIDCHCPFEICMNQLQLNQENCPSEKRFDNNSHGECLCQSFYPH